MRIDLHSHTTASDGLKAPEELARLAKEAGVDLLAVTDHDTTEGVAEAAREGAKLGLRVIPGIEMSSRFEDREVHVLGIGIDPAHGPLQERLTDMRAKRRERVGRICEALAGLGVKLDPADVLAEAKGKSVGRKHIARAMLKRGLVPNLQAAFDRYLADGGPAHVPSSELSPAEAAGLIHRAGGVAVLAHPHFFEDDDRVRRVLDAAPIRGLEVHHRYWRPQKYLAYLAMARQRDLIVTGGSDYHGDDNAKNARPGEYLTPPGEWARLSRLATGLR